MMTKEFLIFRITPFECLLKLWNVSGKKIALNKIRSIAIERK